MRKEFLANIVLLVLVNLLIKPFFIFGIDLTVQNAVVADEYGLYFALLNWAYIFQIIGDFGLQNFNTKLVSGHPHLLRKYFPKLLIIRLLLGFAYLTIALAAAVFIGQYKLPALGMLSLLLFNQFLVQMALYLRSNISGLGHYRLDSLFSALDKFLMLLFCGAALVWWKWYGTGAFQMYWFIWAQTAALLLTVGVVAIALHRMYPLRWRPVGGTDRRILLVLLRKSLPFAVVVLLMGIYNRLDGILLERILSDGAFHSNIFAGAYRILDALNMFGYLFASLLLPMFARQLASREAVQPLVSISFRLIWTGAFTACVAISAHGHDLAAIMFDSHTEYRGEVNSVLIWSFLAVCITYVFSTLLTAGEQLRAMSKVFLAGILLDIVLNISLLHSHKAVGAAIASLCTQWFVALGMVWLCLKYYGIRPGRRALVQMALFMAGTVGCWWLLQQAGWPWYWRFLGVFVGGGISALLTRWVGVFSILR